MAGSDLEPGLVRRSILVPERLSSPLATRKVSWDGIKKFVRACVVVFAHSGPPLPFFFSILVFGALSHAKTKPSHWVPHVTLDKFIKFQALVSSYLYFPVVSQTTQPSSKSDVISTVVIVDLIDSQQQTYIPPTLAGRHPTTRLGISPRSFKASRFFVSLVSFGVSRRLPPLILV